MPFDHTNLLPDFVQVKVRLLKVTFCPDIAHFVPAFGAAALALVGMEISEKAINDVVIRDKTLFQGTTFIRLD